MEERGVGLSSPKPHCRRNDEPMSQETSELEEDDIPEMDLPDGVRGKYYERYMEGTNVVLLDPDLADVFHDSAVVNQALRELVGAWGTPKAHALNVFPAPSASPRDRFSSAINNQCP